MPTMSKDAVRRDGGCSPLVRRVVPTSLRDMSKQDLVRRASTPDDRGPSPVFFELIGHQVTRTWVATSQPSKPVFSVHLV